LRISFGTVDAEVISGDFPIDLGSPRSKSNQTEFIMKLTSKIAATFTVLAFASAAHAAQMTGGISLGGSYTTDNEDLTLATQVSIGPAGISGATGSFAAESLGFGDAASFLASNPLIFSPITLPGGQLFDFGDGADAGGDGFTNRFSFHLLSLAEQGTTTSTVLNLFGTGFFLDSTNEYDKTFGTWNATFDRQGTGTNATFGFSSSSTTRVPDGGATVALLGMSFLGLGGVSRFLRRK
jgi:hypothetical protein